MSETEAKRYVWRLLDPRWKWHRSFFLREQGYSWKEICVAVGRRGESSARLYAKRGAEEAKLGPLFSRLSVRARKCLNRLGVNDSDSEPLAVDIAREAIRRIAMGSYPKEYHIGRKTRLEILDALDDLRSQ